MLLEHSVRNTCCCCCGCYPPALGLWRLKSAEGNPGPLTSSLGVPSIYCNWYHLLPVTSHIFHRKLVKTASGHYPFGYHLSECRFSAQPLDRFRSSFHFFPWHNWSVLLYKVSVCLNGLLWLTVYMTWWWPAHQTGEILQKISDILLLSINGLRCWSLVNTWRILTINSISCKLV